MAAFADLVRFIPTLGGTTDFIYSSAAGGCQSPALANVQNGVKYKLYAVSNDLTQWEVFEGAYNSGTTTFPRTTVLYNSSGTGAAAGQSGAGTKINFTTVPQVAVVGIAEDLISVEVANSFTGTQQAQARSNIGVTAVGAAAVGQIPGTATNDNAGTGDVGEIISSTIASGSAVALTNNTAVNVTSISLTAGDWDVEGIAYFTGGTATVGVYQCVCVSQTTGTLDLTVPNYNIQPNYGSTPFGTATGNANGIAVETPLTRKSLAATTTMFLVVQAEFSASTQSAFGMIRARRVR